MGGPGHYTVISWDWGYSLFPIPIFPFPFSNSNSHSQFPSRPQSPVPNPSPQSQAQSQSQSLDNILSVKKGFRRDRHLSWSCFITQNTRYQNLKQQRVFNSKHRQQQQHFALFSRSEIMVYYLPQAEHDGAHCRQAAPFWFSVCLGKISLRCSSNNKD